MVQITEDYVSFEIAKLLKEKGLKVDDETCRRWAVNKQLYEEGHFNVSNATGDYTPIPTLQMAMKWLREVHKLFIMIECGVGAYVWAITNTTDCVIVYVDATVGTYKQACEAAIKYCLENLI